MKHYTTKQISTALDIGTSTLRKWCLALEENGYIFTRDEANKRLFSDTDLMVLKHFQELVQDKSFNLDSASFVVASKFSSEAFPKSTDNVPAIREEDNRSLMRYEEKITGLEGTVNELLGHIKQQEQFNQELLHRLDLQSEYIERTVSYRDKYLMDTLKEIRELKQLQIAAASEEKKSIWTRLFKKND